MTDENRFQSHAQRFQSQNVQGRSHSGTPSPPPRSPAAYANGYQSYNTGSYAPAAQNLTSKFQQASNGYNSNNGYANQTTIESTDGNSKSDHQRLSEERYKRSCELKKMGHFPLANAQTQSSRSGTTNSLMLQEKPRSSGSNYSRKDGPPMEQMIIEEAIDDDATKQLWSSLDITNIGIYHFAPQMFAYAFLTQLHISNNHLVELPPSIGALRLLTHLDASNNALIQLPPEMAMLSALKELLLFDNKITSIPAEFGMLYQLEFLGIEGNPVGETIKTMLNAEGTPGFIHYLRDSCPVPLPPPEREWAQIPDGKTEGESFTVFCYNILADRYASATMYGYTPSWALAWDYRKELILHEITTFGADIICLQEIDSENYSNYFSQHLHEKGYSSVFYPKSRSRTMNTNEQKSVDGCATFYKKSMFQVINQHYIDFNQADALKRHNIKTTTEFYNRFMLRDQIAVITMLESKATGAKLMVANVHIFWDQRYRDVKVLQAAMMMDDIQHFASSFVKEPPRCVSRDKAPKYTSGAEIPLIVCGDFNSLPVSGVYEFMSKGFIDEKHEDFMGYDYGDYVAGGRKHIFPLKSAYARLNELPFTNHTPGFVGVIDYIWHTTSTLEVIGLLKDVEKSYIDNVVGFPNAHFPSE